jgi:phenylalanyl-tRNA synthetase beta chain
VRVPYQWLRELVPVSDEVEAVATTLALRGFEVASVEPAPPVIDLEITANRPDCLSIIGLAREAAAAYGLPLQLPDRTVPAAQDAEPLDVAIEDADACPRYCAQMFSVRLGGSPDWLRQRLEAAGLRSINNIVDVTNYVMIEMGQPTHAFDLDRLAGPALRIRATRAGERIRTLDGVERALEAGMLVIADANRPQAIGGVMGGAASEISAATKTMVLESAFFKPSSVRRTSRRLGLKTEASSRFERGADIEAAPAAIARIAALLHQIGAAEPLGPLVDRYPAPRERRTLELRSSRVRRLLGVSVPDADVPSILEPLGFDVRVARAARTSSEEAGTVWTVGVPTFRVDVLREVDLIEEIARHDGYRGLPPTFPALRVPQPEPDARTLRDRTVRHVLTACGLSEAMTFAFIEKQAAEPFANNAALVGVRNPLSEKYDTLRPSLLPGLVDAASHNRRRERRDIRLFETGTRFSPTGEVRAVAGVWCGSATAPHWSGGARTVDFFDIKGVVGALCRTLGITATFAPAALPYFVDGRTAVVQAPEVVGHLGQLDPAILDARGIPVDEALYAFELDLDAIAARQTGDDLRAESLPRFPSVVRDLSILVDSALPAATVRGTIRSAGPRTLVQVVEFDRYRGKGVPDGRVSLSLRLTFRSADRTLTDEEVDDAMVRIVGALASQHGAERR